MKAPFAKKLFFYITMLAFFIVAILANIFFTPEPTLLKPPTPPLIISANDITPLPKAIQPILNPIIQIATKPSLNCNNIKLLSNSGHRSKLQNTPAAVNQAIDFGANGVQISIKFKNKAWQSVSTHPLSSILQVFSDSGSENNALMLVDSTPASIPLLLSQLTSTLPALISPSPSTLTRISNLGYKGELSFFIDSIDDFSELKTQIRNLKVLQGDSLVVRIEVPSVGSFKHLIDYLSSLNINISLVQAENISLPKQQALIKSLFQTNIWRPVSLVVSRQYDEFCSILSTPHQLPETMTTDFSSECLIDKRVCNLSSFINSEDKKPLWLTPQDFAHIDQEVSLKLIGRVKIIDSNLSPITPIHITPSERIFPTPMILSFKQILTLSRHLYDSGKIHQALETLRYSKPHPMTIQFAIQSLRGSISPSAFDDPNNNFACYLKKLFKIKSRNGCTISELDTFTALGGIITQDSQPLIISKTNEGATCFSYHSNEICFDNSNDFIRYDYYKSLFMITNAQTPTSTQPQVYSTQKANP
jgi:hypothetical protein